MNRKGFNIGIKENAQTILCALFVTYTVFFHAPLEVFLYNKKEFWFGLREILWIPTAVLIITFLIVCFIGILVPQGKARNLYCVLLFAVGICSWLQGNFFNLKLGLMNGRLIDWPEYSGKMRFNFWLWLGMIALFAVLGILCKEKIVSSICNYLSALMIMIQLVALITLTCKYGMTYGFGRTQSTFISADGLWEVGSERNVIVFVLDSYDHDYFEHLLETNSSEINKLDGFTYFKNYSGLFSNTQYGIVPLITGREYLNQPAFQDELAEQGTFCDDLINQDYSIGIYTDSYEAIPRYLESQLCNSKVEANIDMSGVRLKATELIYRLAWCKYLPDYFKCYLWLYGPELGGFDQYETDTNPYLLINSFYVDGLKNNGITVSSDQKRCYKFIHLYGAHEPFFIGDDLEEIPLNSDFDRIPERAMRLVTVYLDELKELGLYDDSIIVITSDHGYQFAHGKMTNPILLIKKQNEHGELKENNAPVSQADYGATMVDLIGGGTVYQDEESAFKIDENATRQRFFYDYMYTSNDTIYCGENGNSVFVEYTVDSRDCKTSLFKLTGIGINTNGDRYRHEEDCETCKKQIGPSVDGNALQWKHVISR